MVFTVRFCVCSMLNTEMCGAAWLFSRTGIMTLGPAPSLRFMVTRLLPIVLSGAGALYFGNVAYLSLSVAFIQILKVGGRLRVTSLICALQKVHLHYNF